MGGEWVVGRAVGAEQRWSGLCRRSAGVSSCRVVACRVGAGRAWDKDAVWAGPSACRVEFAATQVFFCALG